MLTLIKDKLAARSLAKKQKAAAEELQAIYNTREALLEREQFLLRYAARLAAREVDLNVATRRAHRAQLG